MPPSGVDGIMDEEAIIEAEIAQQLEQLDIVDLDDLDDVNDDIDVQNSGGVGGDNSISDDEEYIPPEMRDYVSTIQKQRQVFEQELDEVDDLLHHSDLLLHSSHQEPFSNRKLLQEAAEIAGEDPDEFRQKLLEDLNKEEDGISDLGLDTAETVPNGDTSDEPGDEKALVLVSENQLFFQQILRREMEYMEKQQKERKERLERELLEKKMEEEKAEKESDEIHQKKQREIEEEKMNLEQRQMEQKQKLEQEEKVQKKEIEKEMQSFEENLHKMEEEIQHKKEEFTTATREIEEKKEKRKQSAAITIQSKFRSYIVRKNYKGFLEEKRKERQKRKEEIRIKEVEEERENIRLRKEEDEKTKLEAEEKKKQEEQERLRKEKEDKKRKEEEEKQRKEEEKRKKEEEKRKREEEKREREEEEKRKKEELKRKKEEDARKKKEEERIKQEREKKEEENRKREEERRKEEEERHKQEEEKQRLEAERRKQEEEKQRKEEEEEKRKRDEERLEEENRKKEEERLKKEENEKIKMENCESKQKNNDIMRTESESVKLNNQDVDKDQYVDLNQNDRLQKSDIGMKQIPTPRSQHGREKHEIRKSSDRKLQQKSGVSRASKEIKQDDLDYLLFGSEEPDSDRKMNTALSVMEGLPDNLDKKRLQWIKDCIPWSKVSNEPWKLKSANKTKRVVRRPSSAKKLQLLEEDIITAAAKVETLRQVTTVQLQDLPGCNISTLGQCWGLKYLRMNNCNLVAVEGLHQCKQLQYVDFKDNYIEYVDLKDLGNLVYVNLSKNKISSVHGLDGCTNIRCLDVSHNRITRLGGLEELRRLHTLNLSHNQLISTQGINDTPTLQLLYLSHNHLQDIEDIDKLCLLQYLDVASNNLLKFPNLVNHVLLCHLNLEDNSVSCPQDVTQFWLPLLQTLNLGQNSLEELVSLDSLHIMQDLDLSNNQIIDPDMLLQCLGGVLYLESINMAGNPVLEEVDIRSCLLEKFTRLQQLDGQVIRSHDRIQPMKTRNGFEAMCLTQMQMFRNHQQRFDHDLRQSENKLPLDLQHICDIYFKFCDKTHKLAVEHRYAHEYGEVSMAMPTAPSTPKSNRPKSSRTRTLQKEENYMSPKEMFEKALQGGGNKGNLSSKPSDSQSVSSKMSQNFELNTSRKKITADLVGKMLHSDGKRSKYSSVQNEAATKIQAVWRGYRERKYFQNHLSSVTHEEDDIDMEVLQELHRAAVIIQSHWRGYSFRNRLMKALELARFDDDDDDFEFEDVDMGDFNFDETMLDDWRPPDTPQLPTSHPLLGKPPSGKQRSPPLKIPGLNLMESPQPPQLPRKAWRGMDSPLSDVQPPHRRVPRPPSSLVNGSDTNRSILSKKEEKLSEEWGFKDSQTAHLMLQRAKKLKYNAARRKKLSKLDPKQRLALFRKLEEVSQIRPVHQPSRKTLPRKEYFQARQEEIDRQDYEKRIEKSTKVNRTFEWLHTQVGSYDVTDSCIQPQTTLKRVYGSDGNLPKLNPDIAAGKPVRLVNSPASMDLQSVDSASIHGDRVKSRRMSTGTEGSYALPPIKTGSAPSVRPKEKMSWRSPDVNKSSGWGGGKKRTGKR